jgi:hypothetical protein
MKKFALSLLAAFDLRDAFVFGGIGLVGYGIGQIYAPAAPIAVGCAFFLLGIRKAGE